MARGSINKVMLIGTLGRDVEMRYMPNGNAVANCSLATDEGYKDRNTGQHVDKTEWHRVEAFGRLAEIMGEYLKKGSKVYVEGKLRTDEYEKDGIKRYSTKIIANEMTMLDTRGADTQGGYQPNHQPRPSAQPPAPPPPPPIRYINEDKTPQAGPQPTNAFDDFDDDIPF